VKFSERFLTNLRESFKMSCQYRTVLLPIILASLLGFCDSDVHSSSAPSYSNSNGVNIAHIALQLDKAMYGNAYAKGTPECEHRRPVHNGACKHIFPAIIAVPHNTDDVSLAVQTAVQHDLPVSFRSGGHSFICQVGEIVDRLTFGLDSFSRRHTIGDLFCLLPFNLKW